MFEELETRAGQLCIGTALAIIFLGKFFGGSLWGLVPLALCISCGVFLWAKDVVQKGLQMEWSSEQLRGETVSCSQCRRAIKRYTDLLQGYRKPPPGICRMDELLP